MTDTELPIHADVMGDRGSPVLLLHGIGSSAASFAAQLPYLSGGAELGGRVGPGRHRVVAWDAPGYARSGDTAQPYRMDDFADAAATLLDRLGHGPAHVVGVSWGGVIATRLALRRHDAVRSLVLAASTCGSGRTPEKAAVMRSRADELARTTTREFARVRAPRLLSPHAAPESVRAVEDLMAGAIRMPGYGAAAASMADTDHTPDLPGLRVPTLVVVGDEDRVTGIPEAEHLHRLIAGSRMEVVAGAGHLVNQERPHEFNTLVGEFLRECEEGDAWTSA